MADIYAIMKWRPQFADEQVPAAERIRIGVVGRPDRMRTVRSLLLLLRLFAPALHEVVLISDREDPFAPGQRQELESEGLSIRVSMDLNAELPGLDVVYINSIAWVGDSYEKLAADFRLSGASPLKPGSIVLHPLARGEELATDLDATEHNWYFAQARGAVFMRMALLACLLKSYS